MPFMLKSMDIPDFGAAAEKPAISITTYETRCNDAVQAAGCDWLVVYADREHQANMDFLTGFEPRFEEALLLLGQKGERIIITGNENQSYTAVSPLPDLTTLLAQSLSLMAQDRTQRPDLVAVLSQAGLSKGDAIGLVGWKYLENFELRRHANSYFVPSFIVDSLTDAIGASGTMSDATAILMHPATGLRAAVGADAIAEAEWGASRASAAVWRILTGFTLGESELMAASRMGYAGEPMTCHPMFATSGPFAPVIGLASPTSRIAEHGDGVTTAVGYWGGLTARAGLLVDHDNDFLDVAKAYYAGVVTWYETADIGVEGGALFEAVTRTLASGNLKAALNPGHLTGHDEWIHTPIRPGSTETIASGMPFQVDIIPTPMRDGWALNMEDPVSFADQALRDDIRARYPELWQRFADRKLFASNELGIETSDNILFLSAIPLCLPPFWLKPDRLLTRS